MNRGEEEEERKKVKDETRSVVVLRVLEVMFMACSVISALNGVLRTSVAPVADATFRVNKSS